MLRRALELDPAQARTHCTLGAVLARHPLSWEEAQQCFEQALQLDDYDCAIHLQYAQFLSDSVKDTEAAEEHFLKALSLDVHGGTPPLLRFLVQTRGRAEGAERFVELLPDATEFPILALFSMAEWFLEEHRDYRLAEGAFKRCAEIPLGESNVDPELYAQILLRYAFFLVQHMRQLETARAVVQRAAEAVPEMGPDLAAQFQTLLSDPSSPSA